MPEPQIRHVRFFNGQFLRQQEFNEEQTYANHMRRRLNYSLFQDGVVEITGTDLTIAPVSPGVASDKRIRILRGLAVGANQDVFESREVILRQDTAIIDLAATFSAGQTVWASVNYQRTEAVPVAVGPTTENSRFDETAQIQFFSTNPTGQVTAGFDPLIVLGSVNFNAMTVSTADRQIARLRSALFAPAPSITISPTSVTAGATQTFTITSGGGFNLSTLVAGNVSVTPGANIGAITIVGAPTANTAQVNVPVGAAAAAGTRQLNITIGAVTVSDDFSVTAFVPPPTITSLPGSTSPNALLTIGGTNFIAPVSVTFNNGGAVRNSPFTGVGESLSNTQIVIRVPAVGANSGTITIQAAGGSVLSAFINIV